MVYCGKPSRGCQNCKTRRIKCDEVRPSCSQCIKSKRECPGYPDEFDLIFRNETAAVKRRAQRSASNASAKITSPRSSRKSSTSPIEPSLVWESSPINFSPQSDSLKWLDGNGSPPSRYSQPQGTVLNYEWQSPNEPEAIDSIHSSSLLAVNAAANYSRHSSPSAVLGCSPRSMDSPGTRMDFAIAFFFRHLVQIPRSKDSLRGYMEVLGPMYMNARADSILHKATHALALASLSNGKKSPLIRMEARRLYTKALKETGEAIRDPVQARSDELLMSIMLFSLYESITVSDSSRIIWTRHINGAVTLVKLRGEAMMTNPTSLHLFRTVRAHMLTATIQQQKTVEEFPGLKGWHCDEDLETNAANRLTLICINLPNIKYCAQDLLSREKTASTIMEMMKLIRIARETDSALERWTLTLDDVWDPRVKMTMSEEPDDVTTAQFWKGPVHLYKDLGIASVWNDYRISRIFCQAVVLGCVAALPRHLMTSQVQRVSDQAINITQQMVDEFCSAVPYLFGLNSEFEAKKMSKLDQAALRATGAYHAAWPLWVMKKIPSIPGKQREWLLSRFKLIGKTWGLSDDQMINMAQSHAMTAGPQFSYETYGEVKKQHYRSAKPCAVECPTPFADTGGTFVRSGGNVA